jgi:hypothetical protein
VDVDEARRHRQPRGIQIVPAGLQAWLYGGNAAIGNGQVAGAQTALAVE